MDGFGWLLLKAGIPWFLLLNMLPVMIFLERKGSALIGDRVGPNRTFIPGIGLRLAGLVQNFADVVKLLTKEEFIPNHVSRRAYLLAPMFALFVALIVGAVVPYTPVMHFSEGRELQIQALDSNLGLLLLLAVSSLGVYAVTMAGWASNNKYSLMGGLRASAQMVSYELSMGLAVVGLFMVYGSTTLDEMVVAQGDAWLGIIPKWGVLLQPIGFVLFLLAGFAETNRTPFDMAEGESEIVGFHVEYGGMKFALFFMAEYVHMVVVALVTATCYFGGYQVPWISPEKLAEPACATKVTVSILLAIVLAGVLIGLRLLKWHQKNRRIWQDSRKREGAVLALLLGFGPAALAALLLPLVWGSTLGANSAALIAGLVGFAALFAKTLFFCWLFVWVRWTLPRFRYDQLMGLGWKLLVPVGIANIFITGILVKLGIW
ncbi:MAG: NADH-quinone oxidoreductase subunit H [Planctomycetes bacterium]|nr:NADH-quinone oxidoreductase subunit H [Planctomycetota bacterium]